MNDASDRLQAVAFVRDIDRSVAGELRAVASPEGADGPAAAWAVLDRQRPLVWDANYVWVSDTGGADAAALSHMVEATLDAAGMAHRLLVVANDVQGRALAGDFRAIGWHERSYLVMAHRDSSRLAECGLACELDPRVAMAGRRELIVDEPWGTADVAEQILSRDTLIERATGGRAFGVPLNGTAVSHCQLFLGDGLAQVENVGTRLAHRNRGLGRTVVSLATRVAREHAELVFLCADAHDWPQQLYRRLGYEAIGLLHRFCPTLPGPPISGP